MTPQLHEILQQVLALPAEDRAVVAAALEQSLGESPAEPGADAIIGDALLQELQRRSAAYRLGQTTARPVEEVLGDLHCRAEC